MKPEYMKKCMQKYGLKSWDSVLAAVGHGGLKEGQVVNKLVEEYEKVHKKQMTDQEALMEIAEKNRTEKKPTKVGRSPVSPSRGSTTYPSVFPNAAVRFRETRSSVSLPGDGGFPFTGQTV